VVGCTLWEGEQGCRQPSDASTVPRIQEGFSYNSWESVKVVQYSRASEAGGMQGI